MHNLPLISARENKEVKVQVHDASAHEFAARLKKMEKVRRKWARKHDIFAYRVYDADLPNFSVAIDVYDAAIKPGEANKRYVVIAEYRAPKHIDEQKAKKRFQDIISIAPHVLGASDEHVFIKSRVRARGGSQYGVFSQQACKRYVRESDLVFAVDFTQHVDTGLFLDHRPIRNYIQKHASNKHFLNLFAYTGAASVYAAAGGARSTTTVDISNTYTAWAQENMKLNGFCSNIVLPNEALAPEAEAHTIIKADCLQWIKHASKTFEREFDLIFIDPPTFSNGSAMASSWDIQRDHVTLLKDVQRLLSDRGAIIFSGNLRKFSLDTDALSDTFSDIQDITQSTIPQDFERNKHIHFCFILQK